MWNFRKGLPWILLQSNSDKAPAARYPHQLNRVGHSSVERRRTGFPWKRPLTRGKDQVAISPTTPREATAMPPPWNQMDTTQLRHLLQPSPRDLDLGLHRGFHLCRGQSLSNPWMPLRWDTHLDVQACSGGTSPGLQTLVRQQRYRIPWSLKDPGGNLGHRRILVEADHWNRSPLEEKASLV